MRAGGCRQCAPSGGRGTAELVVRRVSRPLRPSQPPRRSPGAGDHGPRLPRRADATINAGVAAIEALGAANDFEVDTTQTAADFTAANLEQYRAIVFLGNAGDPLNAAQESALQGYIQDGGGFVGIGGAAEARARQHVLRRPDRRPPGRGQPDRHGREGRRGRRPRPSRRPRTCRSSGRARTSGTSGRPGPPARSTPWRATAPPARPPATAPPPAAPTGRSPGAATSRAAAPSTPAWAGPPAATPRPTSARTCWARSSGAPAWSAPAARRRSPPTTGRAPGRRLERRPRAHRRVARRRARPQRLGRSTSAAPTAAPTRSAAQMIGAGADRRASSTSRTATSASAAATSTSGIPQADDGTVNSGVTLAGILPVYGDRGGGAEINGKIEAGLLGITVVARLRADRAHLPAVLPDLQPGQPGAPGPRRRRPAAHHEDGQAADLAASRSTSRPSSSSSTPRS